MGLTLLKTKLKCIGIGYAEYIGTHQISNETDYSNLVKIVFIPEEWSAFLIFEKNHKVQKVV